MGPTASRSQPKGNSVSNGLRSQHVVRVDAQSCFLKDQSKCMMQAPDVHLDGGSGDPTGEGCAPVCVLPMEPIKVMGANAQLNLASTLGNTGMPREKIKNKKLCQGKPQLIFASAIHEEYRNDFFTGQAVAPWHPKAMHNAKMWPC